MTMRDERTRALVWAGGFLIELVKDKRLPIDVRRSAIVIARHFPTIEDISFMSAFRHPSGLGIEMESPYDTPGWAESCKYGPLTHSTRLQWPE